MEQVAVRGVEFDEIETGPHRPRGRRGEGGDDLGDVLGCHLLRLREFRIGDGAGPCGRPSALGFGHAALGLTGEGPVGAGLAAGVRELDADDAALGVDEVDDGRPGFGLLVVPDPGVLRGDAPFRDDGGGLGEDEPEASLRAGAEVDEVPGPGHAVLGLAGVLAHRSQPDAVADLGPAQGQRFEQLGHGSMMPVRFRFTERSRIPERPADTRSR